MNSTLRGFKAAQRGNSKNDCPFEKGSTDFIGWHEGFAEYLSQFAFPNWPSIPAQAFS